MFLCQYFEGADLPEATAREIDLLMDQADHFPKGVPLSHTLIVLWHKHCTHIIGFYLFSLTLYRTPTTCSSLVQGIFLHSKRF